MKIRLALFAFLFSIFGAISLLLSAQPVSAVTCSISSDTVINQTYVTSNACTAIDIQGNVSTTWVGTVDLSGGTVTVKTGYRMTMGSSSQMILGASDDFVIESGATTTHLLEDINGIKITARNITINGSLSASEKGCRRSGAAGDHGYGVNVSTGVCGYQVGGYGRGGGGGGAGGSGASHAGFGGASAGGYVIGASLIYGNSLFPSLLGSGGGTGYYSSAFGGAGGGLIHVTSTGTLTVNGTILAKGGNGSNDGILNGGGGGAGGSILIRAGVLAGTGTISVDGGNGSLGGGAGGAGRVALYYGSSSFSSLSNITASRGTGGTGGTLGTGAHGGYGTTYILNRVTDDGAGTLTITSGHDFHADGDYTRDAIDIASGAYLTCATTTSLTVSSTAAISLSNVTWTCPSSINQVTLASTAGLSTTSTAISFTAATSLSIVAPVWTNVTTTVTHSRADSYALFDISSDLTLRDFTYTGGYKGGVNSDGGLLQFSRAYGLTMVSSTIYSSVSSSLMTSLTIDSRSSINASAKGCYGSLITENGYGPNTTTGLCAITTSGYGKAGNGGGGGGGGAAHAGTGGAGTGGGAAQTTTYGSSTYPILVGSGGGGGYWQAGAAGGNGGGRIFLIISGTASIGGSLKADGGTGLYSGSYNAGGGGSGGSIYLRSGTMAGSGSITADGGSSQTTGGGGGGGGRIALVYSTLTYAGTSSTTAGTGGSGSNGTVGSLYTLQLNTSPDVPSSLGQTSLVNGSTTSTGTPTVTFSLSDPDVSDTVKYRIQIDDSSDFGSPLVDYTSALAAQGSASFQVGQSAGSGAYNITSSSTLPNGSFYWRVKTIDQNSAESSYVAANSGSVAFIVDATPRYLSFQSTSSSGLESVTATSVRILLDQTHFENVTVNYSIITASTTADGSGTDYTLASGTATITAGQTSTTVSFSVVNDDIDEPNETIGIQLSSPVYAVIGSNTSTLYTIIDNDTAGVTITESSGSTAVTEGGSTDSFTVVLTSQPTSTVQVLFSTSTNGLTLSTSTLTFTSSNWSSAQTVTVSATDDSVYESTHATSVAPTLSTTAYGYNALSITPFTVTITDNESSDITLSASTLSVTEGASNTYTLVLTSAPTSTVQILLSAGTGLSLSTSTLTFTSSNYSTAQTVTVSASNDSVHTGNRSSSVTQTASSTGNFATVSIPSVSVSIVEDDAQGGGGFAGGAGAGGMIGSTIPTWFNSPPPPPPPSPPTTLTTPPLIVVLPPRSPDIPATPLPETNPSSNPQIITILNPSDVLSLVEATNGGRDFAQEARQQALLRQDAREFRIPMSDEQSLVLANFVTYGISGRTRALGSGERRALVRDALQTMGTSDIPPADFERLVRGQIPQTRNLAIERQQLPRVRQTFRTLYGRDPNFQNPEENLAWNTLMYRIRFERDLSAERQGIEEFRRAFRRDPRDPFQWSVVRVMGYVRR